jgi:hypothetical protein
LTTTFTVGIITNVKALELVRTRVAYSETAFAELVLWQIPKPLKGSSHVYKYRLAYVVEGQCVLRYDNETGKGDHRHYGSKGGKYAFATPDKLIADFQRDIARWNDENRHS